MDPVVILVQTDEDDEVTVSLFKNGIQGDPWPLGIYLHELGRFLKNPESLKELNTRWASAHNRQAESLENQIAMLQAKLRELQGEP